MNVSESKWNKYAIFFPIFLIIAYVLRGVLSGWSSSINEILEFASPFTIYLFSQIALLLPMVVVLTIGIFILRTISRRGEKGRTLMWFFLALPVLTILWQLIPQLIIANKLTELTGKSATQIVNDGGRVEIVRAKAREAGKLSDVNFLKKYFLEDFRTTHGRYPNNSEEIDGSWKHPNVDIDWEQTLYTVLEDGNSYVIRTQIDTDYLGTLKKIEDRDGTFGEIYCGDDEFYYCVTPD